MKAVVVGIGTSGRSACRYLHSKGYAVWAIDDKAVSCDLPFVHFCKQNEVPIQKLAFVVLSPGVPLHHPIVISARCAGIEILNDIELAFRELAGAPPQIAAITGTNGKTTTTLLLCHMLQAASFQAKAVGNIGLPLLDVVSEKETRFVLELSSFQLQTMQTAILQAGCILNISPNHLDHHASYEEYIACKQRLGLCIKPGGNLYVHEKVKQAFSWSQDVVSYGFSSANAIYTDGRTLYRFGEKEAELPDELAGTFSHHVENFLAAFALAREFGVAPDQCVNCYSSFQKPSHRIQFVKECNGVAFFDDSKATNVDAVLRALDSFQKPIVLIAGGVHKGFSYESWKVPCKNKVRACVVFGASSSIIKQELQDVVPVFEASSLDEAVKQAYDLANKGDVVLLSPGCSSYDMFKNYEERGNKFQDLVKALDSYA